jgi:hypothetical protein
MSYQMEYTKFYYAVVSYDEHTNCMQGDISVIFKIGDKSAFKNSSPVQHLAPARGKITHQKSSCLVGQ